MKISLIHAKFIQLSKFFIDVIIFWGNCSLMGQFQTKNVLEVLLLMLDAKEMT